MPLITREMFENKGLCKKASEVVWDITSRLAQPGDYIEIGAPFAAYLLCKASQQEHREETLEEVLARVKNENIRCMARERINAEAWNRLVPLIPKYTTEELAMATLVSTRSSDWKNAVATPSSIVQLAHELLAVKEGENVADVCCGVGTYLVSAAMRESKARYYGYEINAFNAVVAQIRAELIDADVQIVLCDAFQLAEEGDRKKYNKIFSDYPFGLKLRNLGAGASYLERISAKYPGLSKATSSDWVFNALLCDLMEENGKAIGIMTNGSTWNSIDTTTRKYFVEQGLIECVIALPAKMFSYTMIPTTLIVFSHGNEDVRMVDATKLCQQGRRQNEFSQQNIIDIVEATHNDSEYSKVITTAELRENEYCLNLSRYLTEEIKFSNGVPFESIVKSISRGAPCTATQLDGMVADGVTNMQYLMLANIQDGMIDDKLPYLSSIDPKFEKYCLKNNSLILSKNGYPYKVAVVAVKEGQRILANGNLYIIELDEQRVNPYYVKAFFDSEQGIAALKSITVGATIPNIGVDKLKKLLIPVPSMEEQLRIAREYQAAQDEIAMLKLRLEKTVNRLHHIFDEECG